MAKQVNSIAVDRSEGFKINKNRPVWDEIYAEIRRLSVTKALKIREFTNGSVHPQKVCVYRYGEAKFLPAFEQLTQPQQHVIKSLMAKIVSLYNQLKLA